MKNLIILLLISFLSWQSYTKYQDHKATLANEQEITDVSEPTATATQMQEERSPAVSFKCDGRTHCSEMTSCQEANYFLRHCPGVKMDGDNDGRPCEKQWCG